MSSKHVLKACDLPTYYNAIDVLEHNLPERADKIALYSRERTMTFQQVSDEANRVGRALKRLGVRAGECVGLLALGTPEWPITFFGIMKIGAVAVAMNTLLTPAEYEYILRDARIRVLIVHATLLPAIDVIRDSVAGLEHVVVIGTTAAVRVGDVHYDAWISGQATTLAAEQTHRDDFCSLNYTSGTTGRPKGVFHSHKDYPLTAHAWGVNVLGLNEDDRTFAVAKLFFPYGIGGNLIFPWSVGASCVLFSGSPRATADVFGIIEEFAPTILYSVPTGYAMMLASESLHTYDLSSLRLCVSAGEALPAILWHRWKAATGLDILDGIGSTENFQFFLSNCPDDIRPGSSGRPVDGYQVKIVNDAGDEVGVGEIGDLLVKGETAALFYLHQYERSRQTFRGEWLFTGDKYYVDEDGYYWYVGRSDDMMKVGGIWVSPIEVEQALRVHPAVFDCAVVPACDADGLIKPKAFVMVHAGYHASTTLAQELIDHCGSELASYKRPRTIVFVDELPRTATGKIQRYRLREPAVHSGSHPLLLDPGVPDTSVVAPQRARS